VKGGDLDIIQICEQEHGDFSDCLQISVTYLRNDVADWLLQNFTVKEFTYGDCIYSLNFAALAYLHAEGSEVLHPEDTDFDSLKANISFLQISSLFGIFHRFLNFFISLQNCSSYRM
jgi:hypothetical protein